MSWVEKLQDTLTIVCGDGKTYSPYWSVLPYSVDYNIAEFDFPNLENTLIYRGTPRSRRFSMEIFFQGVDHLDKSEAFRKSANDKRPWTFNHPLYGRLLVQPISLSFDDTGLNVTKISGTIVETISEQYPKVAVEPIGTVRAQKAALDNKFIVALTAIPGPTDLNKVSDQNKKNFKLAIPKLKVPEEIENYFNLFTVANAAINQITALPLDAMREIIAVISAPALFTMSVKNRMEILTSQFENVRIGISTITLVATKQLYQNMAGSIISTQCLASILQLPGDYRNSGDSLAVIDQLIVNFNRFVNDLDFLQTPNGGNVTSFIPDAESLMALNDLLYFTIANLQDIALNSRYERSFILPEDSNVIVLTHRFYGLDADDKNLDEFIANNNIGLNGLLQLKKGMKLIYYTK
jgi:hypothetical protein